MSPYILVRAHVLRRGKYTPEQEALDYQSPGLLSASYLELALELSL
jgi:hypothetical protein